MTHDFPVDFNNQGNVSIGFPAKPVDKIGFSRKLEFRGIQGVNRSMIIVSFRADQH